MCYISRLLAATPPRRRRMLFLARSVRMPLPHALPSPCVHAAMTGRATHSQPSAAAHPSLYDRCLFILSSVPLGEVQSAPGLFLRVSGVSRQRRVVAVACPAWTDFPLCRCRQSGIRWWYPRFDKKKTLCGRVGAACTMELPI